MNIDKKTVEGFGDEWTRFDQTGFSDDHLKQYFDAYFDVFPWDSLCDSPEGFDAGAGSGRWAKLVAPKVGRLIAVEPSSAAAVAKKNLSAHGNCEVQNESIDTMKIADSSMDFGYSLGVLHHIPNTEEALRKCVLKLKSGAPFLLYLYYAFDNRPAWYRWIWVLSEPVRFVCSRSPHSVRYMISQLIAFFIYFPLVQIASLVSWLGFNAEALPLSSYRNKGLYVLRTDALDRFGTRLEKRFTKAEIEKMMSKAGLENIVFSDSTPYWCAVGTRMHHR